MNPWRWGEWQLAEPMALILLLVPLLVLALRRFRGGEAIVLPFASQFARPVRLRSSAWPAALMGIALVLAAIALARPQKVEDKQQRQVDGYDIMLVIDLSESMLERDYEINGRPATRLEAIKPIIEAFINRRTSDRMGIVVFGDVAYTLAPLTFDHAWLRRQTERLYAGVAGANTAIGDGLGVALQRLNQVDRIERGKRLGAFVVLLTDGENNRGALQPMQSAELAQQRGIPIYSIGAGSERRAFFGMGPVISGGVDEETLQSIAQVTGGQFFSASSADTVARAFEAIDQAEKIEFQATSHLLTEDFFTRWLTGMGIAGALAWLVLRVRPMGGGA